MENQDYYYDLSSKITTDEALDAISRVPDWWATNFEGSSDKIGDVFTVHFGEVWVTFNVVEKVPGKKMVWLVTDCYLQWLEDKKEWVDTKISWEVTTRNNSTHICMTHIGLVPALECFNDCKAGWDFHVGKSLFNLITEGIGMPDINTRD